MKKHLNLMVQMLQTEEDKNGGVGECLEYLIENKIPMVVIGLAKSNQPPGLLYLGLRFMIVLLTTVKSA